MLVMVVFFIAFRWIHLSTPLIRLFLLVLILLLMPTLNFLPVWFALSLLRLDRKSGSAGMPRPISYAVFCLKKKMAQSFLREFAKENDKKVNDFAAEALEAMMKYRWPGNVRELRTSIERAVVFCRGEKITQRDLPANVRADGAGSAPRDAAPVLEQNNLTVEEAEKQLIIREIGRAAC